jgi:hypothetical protein
MAAYYRRRDQAQPGVEADRAHTDPGASRQPRDGELVNHRLRLPT